MSLHLTQSNSLFLHIPKTGGTWIEEALKAAGVAATYSQSFNQDVTWRHHLLGQQTGKYDFIFAFVRHPISWYESWWKFQTALRWVEFEPGVWHPQRTLEQCASDNFTEFIQLCLEREPAYVSRMYEWYIGPPGYEFTNFVGRCEHLADDLVRVLRQVGEKFDEDILRSVVPANVSPVLYGKPVWHEALKGRMTLLEKPAIRRFYQDDGTTQA
jgi:Sulfotransferase family